MPDFVRTDTILDKILANTVAELAELKRVKPLSEIMDSHSESVIPRDMVSALRKETVGLIAEVKHASPSKGILIEDFDPLLLGKTYAANGASVISILTDQTFFKGHLEYLKLVRSHVQVPVLRKDFIIDPYQVYEGRLAGADAVLLIVSALEQTQLKDLYQLVDELGMTALVEVHTEAEVERALELNPKLLGVNNRDLKTFDVDLENTLRLITLVPDEVTFVAESGIKTTQDIYMMGEYGAHAVLVGETLVRSERIAETVRSFSAVRREVRQA